MTVVFMDGFDHYAAASGSTQKGWTFSAGGFIGSSAGRIGSGQCANVDTNSTPIHVLPGSYSEAIAGIAIGRNLAVNGSRHLSLYSSGTVVASLFKVVVGPNTVYRIVNVSGTTLGTGTTPVVAYPAFTYLEMRVKVGTSTGEVELRLNGSTTPEILATGVNTGSSNINQVAMNTNGGGGDCAFDDLYVVDTTSGSAPTNTFLGDVRVETIFPNGNGANTAWSGVYTDWDDTTSIDSDTTYVSSSTPGDRETSTLQDLALATGTVHAVQVNLIARKDDAGNRTIAPVIRIGSTNYDGTTAASLSTSYLGYAQLYDRLDPSGAAWTVATVNAMEAGVKEVS